MKENHSYSPLYELITAHTTESFSGVESQGSVAIEVPSDGSIRFC
jgi:hypothetical protein